MSTQAAAKSQDVDITKIPPNQLVQLSKAIEGEVESLTGSYSQLMQAV